MILFCMKMNLWAKHIFMWFRRKTRFDTEAKSNLEAAYSNSLLLMKPSFLFPIRKLKVKLVLNVRFKITCAKL